MARHSNTYITIGDETKTIQEWSKQYGINSETVRYRIEERGMEPIDALTAPRLPTNPPKKKKEEAEQSKTFIPRQSPEDKAKCKKCGWSERAGVDFPCMYMELHRPRERRGCEPGKNCIRFTPKSKKIKDQKIASWTGGFKL